MTANRAAPRTALQRWLRGSRTRRIFASALGGGERPNDTYLRMATTMLDQATTYLAAYPVADFTWADAAAPPDELRAALVMLIAAAADTDRNMRSVEGDKCDDCGHGLLVEHDDDCGMAGLAVARREARRFLAIEAEAAAPEIDVEAIAAIEHEQWRNLAVPSEYAVNHIEQAEADLAEALALLERWMGDKGAPVSISAVRILARDTRRLLAAHGAGEGQE